MKLGKRDLAGKKQAPEEVSLQACVASKGRSEDSQAKAFPVHCWVQGSTWAWQLGGQPVQGWALDPALRKVS